MILVILAKLVILMSRSALVILVILVNYLVFLVISQFFKTAVLLCGSHGSPVSPGACDAPCSPGQETVGKWS